MSEKKRYVKVTLIEHNRRAGSFLAPAEKMLDTLSLFDGAEVGETLMLELVEMTESEFLAIPEFTGF